jgi:hypothetical protein
MGCPENEGEVGMRSVQTGGHTEYSPIGHVINVASRMESAAPADGIVVSEETRRLVEGYFELRALGPTELRGINEPLNVYEVVGVGALHGHFDLAARRGLTKFSREPSGGAPDRRIQPGSAVVMNNPAGDPPRSRVRADMPGPPQAGWTPAAQPRRLA